MPRKFERPTLEETLDLLDALTKRYERDIALIDETRELRERTWTINIPEELKEIIGGSGFTYHDATIGEDLNQLPTLYTSKLPSLNLKADPRAGEKTVDDLTTRLEYFTMAGLFEECGARSTGSPTHERLYEGVFSGAAVTMLVKRRDRWADYDTIAAEGYDAEHKAGPRKGERKYKDGADYGATAEEAKKAAGLPIDWLYKDPRTIRPVYEGDELVEVIEVQERDVVTCLKDYGLGLNEAGEIVPSATAVRDWTRRLDEAEPKVEFIQRWNCIWRQYIIRYSGGYSGGSASSSYEIPKHTKRHGYGFLPYTLSLGKVKDYEFARLATNNASETKADLVRYVSWGRTMLGYLATRDAMAMLYETVPPDGVAMVEGDDKKPKGQTTYKMGTILRGQPGATLTAVTFGDVATKLQAEVVQAEEKLRRMGPVEVTGSLAGAGEAMATAFERDRARVNTQEATIVRHLIADTLKFWKLAASFDEPLYVFRSTAANAKGPSGYIKVDPDDFKVAMRPRWTLHVDSMAADMIREQLMSRRVAGETLGNDQSIERQGDNVDEVRKSIAKDKARKSQQYDQALMAEIQARWGRKWMGQQQQAEQMAGASAAAAQPMQPGPVAPQGLAVPAGAEGQTSQGVSAGSGAQQPGVAPGTPAAPTLAQGAATAGVHGGAPLG